MRRLVTAALLSLLGACIVPSLDELGMGRCDLDAGHTCVIGSCVNGMCVSKVPTAGGGGTGTGGAGGSGGGSAGGGAGLRVFVTRSSYFGDLAHEGAGSNGLLGADQLCTLSARAALKGGSWMAFLSTSGGTAPGRFTALGPWVQQRSDGVTLPGFDKASGYPTQGLAVDESGQTVQTGSVWTGTQPPDIASTSTCLDFTSNASGDTGTYGLTGQTTRSFAQAGVAACNQLSQLYCFEQSALPVAPAPISGQRLMFVTSAAFGGALGGRSGADTRCQSAATDTGLQGTWLAWLSMAGASAIDRFSEGPPWYQPLDDGGTLLTFQNRAALAAAPLAAIAQDEHGQDQGLVAYWTGTEPGGQPSGDDCGGFNTSAAQGTIGDGRLTGSWTAAGASVPCSQQWHLVCLQE